jgi:hypothetical protein
MTGACDPSAPPTMMSASRERRMPLSLIVVSGLMLIAVVLAACGARSPGPQSPGVRSPAAPAVTISKGSFHGWEAFFLRNDVAEVTVVPAIGRIMQIALRESGGDRGAALGPLWSHPGIGPDLGGDENGWINLGGDKAWPAPQSRWEAVAGQAWPPPKTFDASPYGAKLVDDKVELLSAVDPAYGLRVRRTIALDPARPIVTVETCYEKVAGEPIRAGVWTITQLVSPERIFMRLPTRSTFPGGFAQRLPAPPKDLTVDGRLLSLTRDPAAKTMVVSDGDALLWVGSAAHLLIEAVTNPHDPSGEWPDGAHAQIYTSSDQALPYIELELLSPLRDLRIGQRASLRVRYTLEARTDADPTVEARRVLGL